MEYLKQVAKNLVRDQLPFIREGVFTPRISMHSFQGERRSVKNMDYSQRDVE